MLEAPAVFASVTDLIAGATERTSLTEGAGKSGARLERVVIGGVVVLGPVQLAATVPLHASQMYARNVLTLVQHLSTKEGALKIDPEDEITKAMLVTLNGQVPGGTGR